MDILMIVGPTAVGKTKLSIALAKAFNAEIINGDAMQFYRGLDIGTAKIKTEEKQGVKHHLLDILEPEDSFSVVHYQKLVREKIAEIKVQGKLPIVVGGSGLYLNAVLYDYQFLGNERLNDSEEKFAEFSTEQLAKILIEKSPKIAQKTDLSNRRRVIRALEKQESDLQESFSQYYDRALVIGLNLDRKTLYQRIDQRVDLMIKAGLIEEVKKLHTSKNKSQATQAIGYKELFQYLDGEITFEQAIDLVKRNSRRYAKRQLTWFRNKMEVSWFDVDLENFDLTVGQVIDKIKEEV